MTFLLFYFSALAFGFGPLAAWVARVSNNMFAGVDRQGIFVVGNISTKTFPNIFGLSRQEVVVYCHIIQDNQKFLFVKFSFFHIFKPFKT